MVVLTSIASMVATSMDGVRLGLLLLPVLLVGCGNNSVTGDSSDHRLYSGGGTEGTAWFPLDAAELSYETTLVGPDGVSVPHQAGVLQDVLVNGVTSPDEPWNVPRLVPQFEFYGSLCIVRANAQVDALGEYRHECGLDSIVSIESGSLSVWEAITTLVDEVNLASDYRRAISIDLRFTEGGMICIPDSFLEKRALTLSVRDRPARAVLCEVLTASGLPLRYQYQRVNESLTDVLKIWIAPEYVPEQRDSDGVAGDADGRIEKWRLVGDSKLRSYENKLRILEDGVGEADGVD